MNLFLRPLENTSDPVWSVIIMIAILLIGVTYYIYTLMTYAFKELKDGKDAAPESEELLQLPSDGDQSCS